jgi:hypothetical protein
VLGSRTIKLAVASLREFTKNVLEVIFKLYASIDP